MSKPRLLITINGGILDVIAVEGMSGVEIELVIIDYDTDGYDEDDDGCVRIEGNLAFVTVSDVTTMSVSEAATARIARDTWAKVRLRYGLKPSRPRPSAPVP